MTWNLQQVVYGKPVYATVYVVRAFKWYKQKLSWCHIFLPTRYIFFLLILTYVTANSSFSFLFFFLWASSHNSRYSGEASSIRPISKVTERYKNLLKASIHFIPCSSQLLEAYSKNWNFNQHSGRTYSQNSNARPPSLTHMPSTTDISGSLFLPNPYISLLRIGYCRLFQPAFYLSLFNLFVSLCQLIN